MLHCLDKRTQNNSEFLLSSVFFSHLFKANVYFVLKSNLVYYQVMQLMTSNTKTAIKRLIIFLIGGTITGAIIEKHKMSSTRLVVKITEEEKELLNSTNYHLELTKIRENV
jgi:hypothetical protein